MRKITHLQIELASQHLQIALASELESDLQDTVDWGKKRLVDFNAGKTQMFSFDQSDNSDSLM